MYANYAVWGGGSGGPENIFFWWGWAAPNVKGQFYLGRIGQCNVMQTL